MTTYLSTPTADLAVLRRTFAPIFEKIAEGAVERERERVFPHQEVQWLKDAAFGTLRIPVERGGLGASLSQVFELLADLGEADSNVAHIWRNHLAFVEDRLNAEVTPGNDAWIERFVRGEFVGGGWTEANNLTLAQIASTVIRDGDRWSVTGSKFYATGSPYADWLDVLGKDPVDGTLRTALVRADQDGVKLVDDWDGFGQQTTGSGSARYNHAHAEDDDVFPALDRFGYQGHFYQTAMLAALVGVTRAVLREGVTNLQRRGRNYPHGLDPSPRNDAQLLQVVGEVSAQVFAAEAALSRAAAVLDETPALIVAEADRASVLEQLATAELAVNHAQLVIIEAALAATTHVFDALGASGVSLSASLDRHWRNARTLASHNPRVYKARVLGAWLTNGTNPLPVFADAGRGGQGN